MDIDHEYLIQINDGEYVIYDLTVGRVMKFHQISSLELDGFDLIRHLISGLPTFQHGAMYVHLHVCASAQDGLLPDNADISIGHLEVMRRLR